MIGAAGTVPRNWRPMDHNLPESTIEHFENGTVAIARSGWTSSGLCRRHAPLTEDVDADVVVIGAGVVGASLALHLSERRVNTAVLEARQPADGASGRNAGHVLPYLGNLEPLQSWPDEGRRLLDFLVQHRDLVFDLCARHEIDADAAKSGIISAARRASAPLVRKATQWKRRGYDVEVVDAASLRTLLGTDRYRHGVYWREGGRVNPYLFTHGLIDAALRHGARVYGDSPTLACERRGQGWQVRTARGSATARTVVLCTNGHAGNAFFPELARTQYPLVACALSTRPLPRELLDVVNPSRVTLLQFPLGLYPMVIDGCGRLVTATIPATGRADAAETYFEHFRRYLNRTWPATRGGTIELASYWTGLTANSTPGYQTGYPKMYRVAEGVLALMNFGAGGNLLGPLLGMNLAHALAGDRLQDVVLPIESPVAVRHPGRYAFKIRRLMIPTARLIDRLTAAA